MRKGWIAILPMVVVLPLFSQDGDTRPRFEVVSIRLCNGTERPASLTASPGRLSVPCFGLVRLIQDAYDVFSDGTNKFFHQPPSPVPIEGFPDQMSSSRYSIEAKTESPQSISMMRGPMMQRVLEDRFHLKLHREVREVPVYLMTVARGGLKLEVTKEGSCLHPDPLEFPKPEVLAGGKPQCGVITAPTRDGSHFVLDERGLTLASFSKLFKIGGLLVIDRTGLTGTYDIHLEWESSPSLPASPEAEGASESPDTSITSSMRKQLGLQLSPGKGPRDVLVIDRLERPTEN